MRRRQSIRSTPPVQASYALEHALFYLVSDAAVHRLLARAEELHGTELIDAHIKGASSGTYTIAACRGAITPQIRQTLAQAAKPNKNPWFKTVSVMEDVAREIVGPDLPHAHPDLRDVVEALFGWCEGD